METIKVNMSPNPLDVQTIHASQNDSEAREWGFALHNNGDAIDSSSISDQLVFKSYEGGTEQILPENGAVPVTAPFVGDIKYPDATRTDQEFLYRQSPTEEDGNAKIKNLYGNTLVWNQLNASSRSTSTDNGITFTKNADGSWTVNGTATADAEKYPSGSGQAGIVVGHKYLMQGCPSGGSNNTYYMTVAGSSIFDIGNGIIISALATYGMRIIVKNGTQVNNLVFRPQLFDLTQMFGSGNEPSTVEEFTSLFPLSYYSYNQGSLLSFNGNGIKTVSKNQFDTQVATTSYQGLTLTKTQGTIRAVYSGGSQYAGFNFYGSPVFTDTFLKGKYRLSFDVKGLDTQWTVGLRKDASFLGGGQALAISNDGHYSFTIDTEANPNCYLSFARTGNKTTAYDVTFSNIQLELGTTETSYTPFEEKTISLPISTYFPTGMKSAGTVYDELLPTKAITRIGAVDLGTQDWKAYTDVTTRKIYYTAISGMDSTSAQIACSGLTAVPWGSLPNMAEKTIQAHPSLSIVYACDSSCEDVTEFTSVMSGVYLYYELATPTETSFTTATLVTENGEVALANENGVLVGKCNSDVSADAGFIEGKIKLSDSDGDVYSNKIQIHVERSPQ